jgi:hypothetical protein
MYLERLTVKNFRNLPDVDLPLQPGTVVVGENPIEADIPVFVRRSGQSVIGPQEGSL